MLGHHFRYTVLLTLYSDRRHIGIALLMAPLVSAGAASILYNLLVSFEVDSMCIIYT